jgi:hypothetical protein
MSRYLGPGFTRALCFWDAGPACSSSPRDYANHRAQHERQPYSGSPHSRDMRFITRRACVAHYLTAHSISDLGLDLCTCTASRTSIFGSTSAIQAPHGPAHAPRAPLEDSVLVVKGEHRTLSNRISELAQNVPKKTSIL